jgi:hypothetical protein
MDGTTEIILDCDNQDWTDLHMAFSGRIETGGGRLAIVTSEFRLIAEANVPKGSVAVNVLTSDLRDPSRVVVQLPCNLKTQE